MSNQKQLDAFLIRAKFSYGWANLESSARRMVEHAVSELEEANERAFHASEAHVVTAVMRSLLDESESSQLESGLFIGLIAKHAGLADELAVPCPVCGNQVFKEYRT